MMKPQIGEQAGAVYRYLEGNGSATLAKLKKDLKLSTDEANLALGWLAREDKVNISKSGASVTVSLMM